METPTHPRAAVYGRESKGKTKSVADQIRIGETTVTKSGWTNAGTYSDTTSARAGSKIRGDWARLRGDLETGNVDVLILWESSRGSRDLTDWSQLLDLCRGRGVLIHVISHERTYDPRRAADYKALATDGVDASHEVHRSSERITRGVAQAAVAGLPHGRIPFGYERIYDPSTREFVEQRPHPVQAPIVVDVITRVASSEPLRSIVRQLTTMATPSPGGTTWTPAAIHHLVRNEAYIGQRRHKDDLHPAVWPAIVPNQIWYLANQVLDTPDRKTRPPGRLRHLLSHLATAPCGGQLRARKGRYQCYDDNCVSVRQSAADEFIARLVVARMSRDDVRDMFAPDDTTARAAKDELARLQAELEAARQSWLTPGGITATDWADNKARMEPAIADAQRRSRPVGASLAVVSMLDAAAMGTEHVRPTWDLIPLPGQRALITTLCASIVVGKSNRRMTRWSSEEDHIDSVAERTKIQWQTD